MVPPIPVPALVRVFIVGVVIVALGCAITPFVGAGFGLVVSLGLLASIGSGAGSFSVLIGAAAQQLPAQSQGTASGVINAGGSFGQFVFAPLMQQLIQSVGWMGAMWSMAALTLSAFPLVGTLTRGHKVQPTRKSSGEGRRWA